MRRFAPRGDSTGTILIVLKNIFLSDNLVINIHLIMVTILDTVLKFELIYSSNYSCF